MRRHIERLDGREIISSCVKIAAASAVMSAACYFSYHFLAQKFGTQSLSSKIIDAFAPIAFGGIVFFAVAKLLGVTEIDKVFGAFARKLGRKK